MNNQLTYRLYEKADLPGLLELWASASGWGPLTEKQFEEEYVHTPYGPCLIVIAVNADNQVVGQQIYTPSLVRIGNNTVKAARISAPILDQRIRQAGLRSLDHHTFAMLQFSQSIVAQEGYQLIYSYPSVGWTAILTLLSAHGFPVIEMETFACFEISLEAPRLTVPPDPDLTVSLHHGAFGTEYDALWQAAMHAFPVNTGVIRNGEWLEWRLRDHTVFTVREQRGHTLKGYVAVKNHSGLIMDMLAATPEDARKNLDAVVYAIHASNAEKTTVPFKALKGMYTPLFRSLLEPESFQLNNYRFAFACYLLDDAIPKEDVRTSEWYLMPGD